MPRISMSQASWWSDAREAQRRLVRRGGTYSREDPENEMKAVRAEAKIRDHERRLARLEEPDEYDPYR